MMVLALELFSHDVRGPLAASRAILTQVLQQAGDESRHLLDGVVCELQRMEQYLEEVLDAERLEPTSMASLALDELLDSCLSECSLPGRLEMTSMPTTVEGDAVLIRSAVLNLIENALMHTEGMVHVHVGRTRQGAMVLVDDDGEGIPPELRDLVFEPCVRLEGHRGGGAGLGLTLVRRVAALHGGSVWMESSPCGGGRACFLLP